MFVLNLFVWAQASSTAIPFSTLVGMVALWLLIQLPLVYAGSWVGYYRGQAWEHPTKTSNIPRQLPAQAWYSNSMYPVLLTGLVPLAVVFIELLFVFRSLWQDKSGYYYVFGFLSVISLVLMVTIVEVTIIAIYVQLCNEVGPARPAPLGPGSPVAELSLVVAVFLHRRRQCRVDLRLLWLVLPDQAQHRRIPARRAILQLCLPGLCGVRAAGGDGGLFGGVCICAAHLRVRGVEHLGGRAPWLTVHPSRAIKAD
jgi:hypothetical protein